MLSILTLDYNNHCEDLLCLDIILSRISFLIHSFKKQLLSIINQLWDHARSLIPNATFIIHNKESSERATYRRYVSWKILTVWKYTGARVHFFSKVADCRPATYLKWTFVEVFSLHIYVLKIFANSANRNTLLFRTLTPPVLTLMSFSERC